MNYFIMTLCTLLSMQEILLINAMNKQIFNTNEPATTSSTTLLQKKRMLYELSSSEEDNIDDAFATKKMALEQCPICLEEINNDNPEQPTHQLLCKHLFHAACINEWHKSNLSCPCCRTIAPEDLPLEDRLNEEFTNAQLEWRNRYNATVTRNLALLAIFAQTEMLCGFLRDDVRTRTLKLLNKNLSRSEWYKIVSLVSEYNAASNYPNFLTFSQFYYNNELRSQASDAKAHEIIEQFLLEKEDCLSKNYENAVTKCNATTHN